MCSVLKSLALSTEQQGSFWARVNKDGPTLRPALGPCWVWTGGRSTKMGYGALSIGGQAHYAHRVSWELANGPIPEGQCVLHRCDNPPCARPDHLFLGTRRDNMADKVAKGRQHRGVQTGNAVFTDEKVMEILTAYATGEFPVLTLAELHKVEEATVRAIVNGESWAHVPGPRLSRALIVAIGKKHRSDARIAAKRAAGWPPGACSVCRERGHYKPRCPRRVAA